MTLYHGIQCRYLESVMIDGLDYPFLSSSPAAALEWAAIQAPRGSELCVLDVNVPVSRLVPDTNSDQRAWPSEAGQWTDLRDLNEDEAQQLLYWVQETDTRWDQAYDQFDAKSVWHVGHVPASSLRRNPDWTGRAEDDEGNPGVVDDDMYTSDVSEHTAQIDLPSYLVRKVTEEFASRGGPGRLQLRPGGRSAVWDSAPPGTSLRVEYVDSVKGLVVAAKYPSESDEIGFAWEKASGIEEAVLMVQRTIPTLEHIAELWS